MHRAARVGLAASALLLGPGFALANTVWIVDASGVGQFTQIQPAIDAAADGDTVLIETGTYSGFVIDDKMLAVVGDSGATVEINSQIVVRNLAAGKYAVLGGFNAHVPSTTALWLDHNAGSVRIQSAEIAGLYASTTLVATRAALVEYSDDVFFVATSILGANGPDDYPGRPGGEGLHEVSSNIALYDCTVRGGRGGQGVDIMQPWSDGGSGGNGCFLGGGFLFASNTTFEGGDGGDTGSYGDCLAGYPYAGDGGHGIAIPFSFAQAELQRCITEGGLGGEGAGDPNCFCGCDDGVPGDPIDHPNVVHMIAGPPRRFSAPLVLREASTLHMNFQGQVDDRVHLLLASQTLFQFSLAHDGVFILPPSSPVRFMGQVSSSGRLSRDFHFPDLGSNTQSRVYFLQPMHLTDTAERTLGTGRCLVVLDRSF